MNSSMIAVPRDGVGNRHVGFYVKNILNAENSCTIDYVKSGINRNNIKKLKAELMINSKKYVFSISHCNTQFFAMADYDKASELYFLNTEKNKNFLTCYGDS